MFVGEQKWPVLSAVRVSTADHPAEFVVLVNCGEGTPRHPYATFQVFIWPHHRSASDGGYGLAERAGLVPTTRVEVVMVPDPDPDAAHYAEAVH
jgi:hypothetical protein